MRHYLISCGKNNIFQVRQPAPHPEQKTILKEIYYLLVNYSKQLICINLRLYLIERSNHMKALYLGLFFAFSL